MAKNKKPSYGEISRMIRNNAEAFATNLLEHDPVYRTSSQVRYFDNQSLVVFIAGSRQGRFTWFGDDDAHGDMLDFYKFQRGGSAHEAVEYAKSFLGLGDASVDLSAIDTGPSDEERQRQQAEEDAERIRKTQWIWEKASPTTGRDAGLAYLRNRGITSAPGPDTLRFRTPDARALTKMGVPENQIPDTPVTSLVFAARNSQGEVTAVQQILTTGGRKVSFDNPKRTNGIMLGSAVWLGDPTSSPRALLAEGPETALSIHQATGIPTCMALGTSNLNKVAMPGNVTTLIVASDMEPSGVGLAAALRTAQYWKSAGIEHAGIALPRLNTGDFNDLQQARGDAAVKSAIDSAYFPPERQQDGTVLATPDARAAFYAWLKTGIEVAPKVPLRHKGKFSPLSLDSAVKGHHNRVLLVETPGIQINHDTLRSSRPEIDIVTIHADSRQFRDLARTPGAVENAVNRADIYAPAGFGESEPVFFSLRRADADALDLEGHKSVAVRSTAIDRVDLSFMHGREAIVAPIGNGTDSDHRLSARLDAAGADTTRLTWQIFRADQDTPSVVRRAIPEGFGAADAAREGWSGEALKDLTEISRANRLQMAQERATTPARTSNQAIEA